jgi:hypothetical protein
VYIYIYIYIYISIFHHLPVSCHSPTHPSVQFSIYPLTDPPTCPSIYRSGAAIWTSSSRHQLMIQNCVHSHTLSLCRQYCNSISSIGTDTPQPFLKTKLRTHSTSCNWKWIVATIPTS